MSKIKFFYLVSITLIIAGITIFFIAGQRVKLARQFSAIANPSAQNSFEISSSSPPVLTDKEIEAQQIEQLRKEIEELKNQQPKVIYQTVLTPAKTPEVDLKTQDELNKAKEQINSLEQKLHEVQAQNNEDSRVVSDANLIKSWQAEGKVGQVACENKTLGSWQLGSGVLVSADGKLITNQHVVQPSVGNIWPDYCIILFEKDFEAQSNSYKKEYRAVIAGSFNNRDAALLQIKDIIFRDQNGQIQSAVLGESFSFFPKVTQTPQIGDAVYIIGYPESSNFSFSITKGIISNFTSDNIYFGTDAQIDRGNSGGAALNSDGRLIGLPTYKFASSGDYRGYILDINSLKW